VCNDYCFSGPNVISGNGLGGLDLTDESQDVVEGNFIGTNATGSAALPNTSAGIFASDGSGNTIGGTTSGAANVISGNGYVGLDLDGESQDVVEGNFIGTNATGSAALPNTSAGIFAAYGSGNTIGGTTSGAANVISGNGGGLGLADESQDVVEGNFIGTDATGSATLPNTSGGISASGGSGNTIGGTTSGAANVISGNGLGGLDLTDESQDVVEGNFIGTNATGSAALPNTSAGIFASDGSGNTIGGTTSGAANVISGNGFAGLSLGDESQDVVEGNFIGTNATGSAALPNTDFGIFALDGSGNTIGGTTSGAGNVISGNGGVGLDLARESQDLVAGNVITGNTNDGIDLISAQGTTIQGNWIGTNSSGDTGLGNGADGIDVFGGATDNTIGGSAGATVTGNVISGNAADGVLLTGSDTTENVVEGNYIGTDSNFVQTDTTTGAVYGAPGSAGIGNGGDGVHITDSSSNNMIGGTDGADAPANAMDGNIIAFNAMNGVAVDSGTGNTIREDLFIDNGGSAFSPGPAQSPPFLPIALGGNATQLNPNSSTAQQGANNLENYPIVTVSYNTPNEIQIYNQSGTDVTVEVYYMVQEVAPDGTVVKAGAQLLGVETVSANGTVQFEEPGISPNLGLVSSGDSFSASIVGTSTDPNGNTSEFGVALTPAQVRTAYGINDLPYDGTGETIAIVSEGNDPNLLTDLDTFDQQFGTTNTGPTLFQQYGPASSFVTVFNQGGAPNAGEIGEEMLDVEWAHAIAPGAHIDVVEGTDFLASVPIAAALPGVSVVSISFGYNEVGAPQPTGRTFTTVSANEEQQNDPNFIAPGVVFLAASGDFGLFDKSYPAFSPYVVAVGGTTLTLNGDGTYSSEAGWGSGAFSAAFPPGGSGGGQSLFEAEPGYQLDVQTTGFRTIPDVSIIGGTAVAIANSYNQQAGNPGWSGAIGTSLSTPVWAGLIALVDQGRADAGEAAFNSNNPEQIQKALYSLPATDFHSPAVLDGYNGTTDAGLSDPDRYDEVTGLGSPIANLLVPDLVAYTNAPTITVSTSSLNLGTTTQGTAGDSQSFTVSGSNLTADIILTAPTGVELSDDGGTSYSSTLDLVESEGTVGTTTVFARITTAAPLGPVSGTIAADSTGATEQDITVSGTVTAPTITVSTNSLDLGTTTQGTPGDSQSFTVSGSNLTADILLTAPTGVELSDNGSSYSTTLDLAESGGTVGTTTILARIAATAPVGPVSGVIAADSTGATEQDISVSGTVNPVPTPTITVSTSSLNLGTTTQGTAGSAQSFTVSGSNLTADILLTAPSGLQLSNNGGSSYSATLDLTESGGTVGTTTILARIAATAPVGPVSGVIAADSTAATEQNISVSGTVNPVPTPIITVSTSSLNLGTTTQGTAGTSQSFSVGGSNLTADILLTAPSGVQLSNNGGSSYSTTLDLVESGGTVGTTTVLARITASAPVGPVTGMIAADSTGATEQDITVSGTVNPVPTPIITVSTSSLNLGTTTQGTAGTSQSFTVSGSNLTADILLTAPSGVQLSNNGGSSYSATLDLTESGGTVGMTTILARIAATAPVGPVSGVIANDSTGATEQDISVSGTVNPVPTPVITVSTSSLNLGTTTQGTAGSAQSFTVSGSNLTADILLTAPTGVELSDNGGTSYSSTLDLVESGGTVGTTTILARIAATAPVGPVSGVIAADSTGATEQDITVSGTVNPVPTPSITVRPARSTWVRPRRALRAPPRASPSVAAI